VLTRLSLIRAWVVIIACVVLPGSLLTACGSNSPGPGPGPIIQPPPPPPPPPPPAPPTLRVTRILGFGDSMTEGVDSPPLPSLTWAMTLDAGRSQSYPFKLQTLITQRYTAQTVNVYNAGWAGRQAREDAGRFDDAVSDAQAELVLLLEGVNDLNAPRIAPEGDNARIRATVDALEEMVKAAGRRNAHVMIGTLPPQRAGGSKAGSVDLVPAFNAAVREMAAKKGAEIVDTGSLPLSLIGSDGLHPTEAGYQRLAEIWMDAIRARYEQAPASNPNVNPSR
jgi:lysophospholipase L1-like esterase